MMKPLLGIGMILALCACGSEPDKTTWPDDSAPEPSS